MTTEQFFLCVFVTFLVMMLADRDDLGCFVLVCLLGVFIFT